MTLVLLTALSKYSVMSNSNLTSKIRGLLSSKKRISLIKYFKSKFNSKGVLFSEITHSIIKNEMHGLLILNVRYSFLAVRLTHAVF